MYSPGKTTVARLYAKILAKLGALPGNVFEETTGARLANEGVSGAKKLLEGILNAGGGTLFLDEAYQLTEEHNQNTGRPVLDFLLAEMENNVGKILFIFAGYNKNMEKFFEHNPGLKSRVPYKLQFTDYENDELLWILQRFIEKRYKGRMKIEDGKDGLYMRIIVKRIGRGRGCPGFGNARAIETTYTKIADHQAARLTRQRREGIRPDDLYLCKEDLIGPDPSNALKRSAAWEKLQKMIGLRAVKESLKAMIDRIGVNYRRELEEKEIVEVSLNRVFLGSPGTGKTSVAELYGKILADIGILSNGEGRFHFLIAACLRAQQLIAQRHSRPKESCRLRRAVHWPFRGKYKGYFGKCDGEGAHHRRGLHVIHRFSRRRKYNRLIQDRRCRHNRR